MVLALGANLQVGLEFGLEKKLAAARAFHPQALGAHVLHAPIGTIPASRSVFRSGIIAVLALEPRHIEPNCKRGGFDSWRIFGGDDIASKRTREGACGRVAVEILLKKGAASCLRYRELLFP